MRSLILLILCIIFHAFSLHSQSLGYRSPGIKWQVMETDTVKVIYPLGLSHKAQRIADVVHQMARSFPIETPAKLRKTSIILQNETSISNGYVGFGPYRSEFYLQPQQNPFLLGGLPWEDLLAIHEYRHVQQLSATNVGLSNLLFSLFGENAYTGMVHLAVPDWYIEGDAVISETALTNQGRGRLAAFTSAFQHKLSKGQMWRYDLLRNGSFKIWLPNEYSLGYLLCNYGRDSFGQEQWDQVIQDAAAYKGLFYSFSKSLKNISGLNTKDFYSKAMDRYRAKWKLLSEGSVDYPSIEMDKQSWSKEQKYRDYKYPTVDGTGQVYTIINRLDKINAIYKIKTDGTIKHVVGLGSQHESYFSMGGDRLAWSEIRIHPRWIREDRSVIMVYDLKKKSKKQITTKGKYFTPGLDASGKKVAALFTDSLGYHNLHILDAASGKVLNVLPNPQNYYFAYPTWSADNQKVLTTARDGEGRMSLMYVDIMTGEMNVIVHWSQHVFGRPVQYDNWIYVTTNIAETDHVFAFNPDEGIPYQVTKGSHFYYSPSYDPLNDEIVCGEFGVFGNRLKRVSANVRNWKAMNMGRGDKDFNRLGSETDILKNLPSNSYTSRKYSSWTSPINLHSANVTLDDPVYEIELLSENLLSTVGLSGGYRYNRNIKSYGPFVNLTLSKWYPELTLGYTGTYRKVRDQNDKEYSLRQNTLDAGVRFPFQFTSGTFNQYLSASSNISVGVVKLVPEENTNRSRIAFLNHSILLYNAKRRAFQHEVPQFAQRVRAGFAHSIDTLSIEQFSVTSDFSFPGLAPNHALILQMDYVRESTANDISLGESFVFSRGYNALENDRAIRFGVNYHFPLIYPDFGVGGIFFLKRIRAKPFFDFTELSFEGDKTFLRSAGSEFFFDLKVFNVQEFTFGFRWARLLNENLEPALNRNMFELFVPLDRL